MDNSLSFRLSVLSCSNKFQPEVTFKSGAANGEPLQVNSIRLSSGLYRLAEGNFAAELFVWRNCTEMLNLNVLGWILTGTHMQTARSSLSNGKECQTFLVNAHSHIDDVETDFIVENKLLSIEEKTCKLDPMDLVAVVKVKNEVTSDIETYETGGDKQTERQTFSEEQEPGICTASTQPAAGGREADIEVEDVLSSAGHGILNFEEVGEMQNEVVSDVGTKKTGDSAGVIEEDHQGGIMTERVDLNLTDVPSPEEFISLYFSPRAESSPLIKTEEDIDAKDETIQAIIESNFRSPVDGGEHLKCDDNFYQPKTSYDQAEEISEWGLCDEDFDSSSTVVNQRASKLQDSRDYYYSHGFKLAHVSIVLEALKFQPSHTVQQQFLCPICHAKFSLKNNLNRHVKAHSSQKAFSCTHCPAKFNRKDNFEYHIRTHSDEEPLSCEQCPARFKQKVLLRNHLRCHQLGEKPFSCKYCSRKFKRRDYLKSHLRTHAKDKPFTCGLCNASFKQKRYLRDHLGTHTNKKRFQCTLCLATFTRNIGLKRHLRRHTKEKPFSCRYCLGRFTRKDALQSHLKVHAVKRQYSCAHCPAKFNRKDFLRAHLNKHSEEQFA